MSERIPAKYATDREERPTVLWIAGRKFVVRSDARGAWFEEAPNPTYRYTREADPVGGGFGTRG